MRGEVGKDFVTNARGRGLVLAIDLKDGKTRDFVLERALRRGLISVKRTQCMASPAGYLSSIGPGSCCSYIRVGDHRSGAGYWFCVDNRNN